jgi:1,4-dihydroxy-2-naphthoate octaprenyltransferase
MNPWLLAIRPKTLFASICPVMIGTAMAYGDGVYDFATAGMCLLGALLIQIGTNLANDYFDFKKGADTEERIGPTRVTQAGLIKPYEVMIGFILAFLLAGLVAWKLYERGGWPIAAIGIASVLSGILYTGTRYAFGYMGLGELFVLIFFGPVAVAGTYYVQSLEMNLGILLAGFAPGLFSVAILAVNNLRDIESDAKYNKRTLAVRFGRHFAYMEYILSIVVACLMPLLLYWIMDDHLPILVSTATIIFAIPTIITVITRSDGPSLNNSLASTGKLLFIYSILFSFGWNVELIQDWFLK